MRDEVTEKEMTSEIEESKAISSETEEEDDDAQYEEIEI